MQTVETNHTGTGTEGLWDKLLNFKIGPVPLPAYLFFAAVIFLASYYGKLPKDMIGGFAVMLILGILLGDMGLRLPVLKDIGGPAILSFFPSLCPLCWCFTAFLTARPRKPFFTLPAARAAARTFCIFT